MVGVLELEAGLYCLSGGLVVNGSGTLLGSGVTFYLVSGDFDTSGNAQVNLAGPPARNYSYGSPPIPGVLIYLAKGNEGLVFLRGTSDPDYVGTVYAPDGTIEVGGTGDSFNVHTQLIGWTVKLHGTPDIFVNFEDESNYQRPANLEYI